MHLRFLICIGFMWLGFFVNVHALTVDEPRPEPIQEQRAKTLFRELRCVVCQGESIVDSPTEVARDLRREVRKLVGQNKDNEAIKNYLVSQYGEHILMTPPLRGAAYFLWFGPLFFLLLGAWLLRNLYRRQAHDVD